MPAQRWMVLGMVLVAGISTLACTSDQAADSKTVSTLSLQGAGATFPAPLYKKWLEEYHKARPGVQISYEAVGSGEGTKRFMAGTVDFGASDAAMSDEEMAAIKNGVQLIPVVAGSIVLAYNLEGIDGPLQLTRDVYVDIFLGNITTWNDPRLQAINPGRKLPSDTIAIVVRQDSSGTTYAFTNHLSAVSEAWRNRGPGTGRIVDWPGNAMVAPGNEGVAGRIKQSKGAIGYVEYGIAKRAGLSMASLENKAGAMIQPHGGSGLATLINTTLPDNLRAFFPDPEGADSYPIVTYSWLLLAKKYDDPQKARLLKDYLTWCLTEGQAFNESFGYIRLAPQVVARASAALQGLQ